MSKFLLDTNVLMEGKVKEGLVAYPVIQELDKLKTSDGLKGKQARDAIYRIYKHPEFKFLYEELEPGESVDDFLLRIAAKYDLIVKTLDLSLHLKGKAIQVPTDYCYNGIFTYNGVTYLTEEDWQNIDEKIISDSFPPNHFLIFKKQAFIIKNHELTPINYRTFDSTYCGLIKPRNIEQYCLTELLTENIPIVCATGKPGSGKSYIMLNYALTQLEKGRINKLVFVPANSYVKDSFDIAALPGGILDKQEHLLGPLIDLVGISKIRALVANDMIEVLPIAVSRGRSFTNSILYCSEAQNLSEDHMQLLISRLGDGSRLFVDGDYQGQIDKKVFENKNGIRLLMNLANTSDAELFGTVRLEKIERSKVAQLAEVLAEFR